MIKSIFIPGAQYIDIEAINFELNKGWRILHIVSQSCAIAGKGSSYGGFLIVLEKSIYYPKE